MLIKKVKLKNIRSYENAEINFPKGSSVLAGDIGTGKTSVLVAVEFALFGLQPGQKGSSLLRNGKEDGNVILEIEIDGKIIEIERGLKRGKSVSQEKTFISIDGEKKEMSVTESKNLILQILNYPKEFAKKTNMLYKFTVYTPQEEMKQIILEGADIRLNTLRHIFGIDKYKRIGENTVIFMAKLRENLRNYEGQIYDLEEIRNKLKKIIESIVYLKNKLEEEKKELILKKGERKLKEEELGDIKKKIEEKDKYERESEKARIMLVGKTEILSSLKRDRKVLEEQIKEISDGKIDLKIIEGLESEKEEKEFQKEEINKEFLGILSEINLLNSKVGELDKLKGQIASLKLCPTCLQEVPEDYKKNLINKFSEDSLLASRKIVELNSNKQKIVEMIENFKKETREIEEKISSLKLQRIKLDSIEEKKTRLLDIEKKENSVIQDIDLLKKQTVILQQSAADLKKYETIYENKNKELEKAFKIEKEIEISTGQTEKEIEISLRETAEVENKIAEKEKIQGKMMYLRQVQDWTNENFLSLIRFTEKNIMLKLKEEFSKLFNEWFNILVPEIFTVKLDDDFTPVIEQQDYQLDYSFLSGGERTAVALAYRLALNQTINSLLSRIKTRDLVILDEPTDGFSEQQLDKMRDVLNELKVSQLIIVSHEAKIESFVENIIRFKKEGGVSKVV